jgi:hypothetical protein
MMCSRTAFLLLGDGLGSGELVLGAGVGEVEVGDALGELDDGDGLGDQQLLAWQWLGPAATALGAACALGENARAAPPISSDIAATGTAAHSGLVITSDPPLPPHGIVPRMDGH